MFQTNVVQKITTHFVFSNFFFTKSCRYELMWENTVQSERPQMTIWRMRIACWNPKVKNIHLEYVMLIAFSAAKTVA
jgi:hypothetical protein